MNQFTIIVIIIILILLILSVQLKMPKKSIIKSNLFESDQIVVLNSSNNLLSIDTENLRNSIIPPNTIIAWSGNLTSIPPGWILCNGENATPDLRGRFILGVNPPNTPNATLTSRNINVTGGAETVTLSVSEIPSHTHPYQQSINEQTGVSGASVGYSDGNNAKKQQTDPTGGGGAHNNMPPFYVLAYIMKINQPSTTNVDLMQNAKIVVNPKFNTLTTIETPELINTFLPAGVIMSWSGNIQTIPSGWRLCNGESGTPDLRGRFVLGVNFDNNLYPPSYNISFTRTEPGFKGGSEAVVLTVDNLPSHTHGYVIGGQWGDGNVSASNWRDWGANIGNYTTEATGEGKAHNNMPPFYVLAYIIKVYQSTANDINLLQNSDVQIATTSNSDISTISTPSIINIIIPQGIIVAWNGTTRNIPIGWVMCNGLNGTPDLRGRFILGVNPANSPASTLTSREKGASGGTESETLTINQIPAHTHTYTRAGYWGGDGDVYTVTGGNSWGANSKTTVSSSTGGNKSHENMPPYYVLVYIMKIKYLIF